MRILLFAVVVLFGKIICHAAPKRIPQVPAPKSQGLDTIGIHKVYLDGDFDEAIEQIESAQRKGGSFSHEDSVFIFKHLGVMYTARYETRERGKSYLIKLLQVEPEARIVDMYASDMIYMIFKNICDEFDLSRAKLKKTDGQLDGGRVTGGTQEKSGEKAVNASRRERKKNLAWMGWTAGALAAAGGVALVVVMIADGDPQTQENIVP